jgi:hypothetical protein
MTVTDCAHICELRLLEILDTAGIVNGDKYYFAGAHHYGTNCKDAYSHPDHAESEMYVFMNAEGAQNWHRDARVKVC